MSLSETRGALLSGITGSYGRRPNHCSYIERWEPPVQRHSHAHHIERPLTAGGVCCPPLVPVGPLDPPTQVWFKRWFRWAPHPYGGAGKPLP